MIRGIFKRTMRKMGRSAKRVFIVYIVLLFALFNMCSLYSYADEIKLVDIDGHWGRVDIVKALDKGYVNGYPGNVFKPNDMVSRAEFIKMLDVVFLVPMEGTGCQYKDVGENKWYAKYIWAAVKAGYMGIYSADSLKPELPISRQDAAALITDLTGITGGNEVKAFKDAAQIADYAKEQVNTLVSAGIMNGDTNGSFRPEDGISRAEAVALINRTMVYNMSEHLNSTLEVKGSVVNIRSGPDTAYAVLTKAYQGDSLTASLRSSNSWYRVMVDNKTGWISGEYVEEVNSTGNNTDTSNISNNTAGKSNEAGATTGNEKDISNSDQSDTNNVEEISFKPVNSILAVTGSVVNIRSGPGTSYNVIAKTYLGNKLTASLLSSNNWYVVMTGGVPGWISADYVKLVTVDNTVTNGNTIISSNTNTNGNSAQGVESEADRGTVKTDRGGDIDIYRPTGDTEDINTQLDGNETGIVPPTGSDYVNNNRLIVVDAGHGGYDSGAVGVSGTFEKDINLSIALKLSELLKSSGYEVLLTRSDDTFIPLKERSVIADNAKAGLFISIHCNATDSHDGYGIETYTQKELYKPVFEHQEECIYLAALVQKELVEALGLHDRGIKKKNLSVCRETNAPTVLIETAFIDNQAEELLLNDQAFQNKAAEAIKRAVDKYFAD